MGWIKSLTVLLFISLNSFAASDASIHSAARRPGESYAQASNRYWETLKHKGYRWQWGSAEQNAVAFAQLPTSQVPVVEDVPALFREIRDRRFLKVQSQPDFARRESWLYPHDGCWIRAGIARRYTENKLGISPMKLFIFGSLYVKTPYASGGSVSWWYHVVPVVADRSGQIYALDPAIESSQPLPIEQWALRQVTTLSGAQFALCHGDTYRPSDICDEPPSGLDGYASTELEPYLNREWNNLQTLGYEPARLLGDYPPWLAPNPE